MPIKSWAFVHDGHPIRAEIWWRFTGWNRKRLYVDHHLAAGVKGRFTAHRPLSAKSKLATESDPPISIRFKRRWFGGDMNCEIDLGGGQFSEVNAPYIDRSWRASEQDGSITSRWEMILNFLIVLLILIPLAILYAPMAMIGHIIQKFQDKRLRQRMLASGRYLSWAEVEKRMSEITSPSTLIQQIGNLAPQTVWWTNDDIASKSPLPLPEELTLLVPGPPDLPFMAWCEHHYFDEQTGKAFLTEIPSAVFSQVDFFDYSNDIGRLHNDYPLLNVVSTGYLRKQRREANSRFAMLIGDNLHDALPQLVAASSDADATIRHLCLKSIELAGEDAAFAVPQLKQQLYLGPQKDRYCVAATLVSMGSSGLDVLKEAAIVGDPRISRSAKSAIARIKRSESRIPKASKKIKPVPLAAKQIQDRRFRNEAILYTAVFLMVLAPIVVSGWFFGTVLTLSIFALTAISTIAFFIWWHARKISIKIKKRVLQK